MAPLKIGQWALNGILLFSGVGCLIGTFAADKGIGNSIGLGLTGLAFLGIGGAMSWYTYKQGNKPPVEKS